MEYDFFYEDWYFNLNKWSTSTGKRRVKKGDGQDTAKNF
jgi:hypothetical protein